jgi:hypothetical protein
MKTTYKEIYFLNGKYTKYGLYDITHTPIRELCEIIDNCIIRRIIFEIIADEPHVLLHLRWYHPDLSKILEKNHAGKL